MDECFKLITYQLKTESVAKIAKGSQRAVQDVDNEYSILNMIHKDGHKKGIQEAPSLVIDLQGIVSGHGYITKKYDRTLKAYIGANDNSPQIKYQKCCADLLEGGKELRRLNIYHGDIKPENCGQTSNEYFLADFGGARVIGDKFVSSDFNPGSITKKYVLDIDLNRLNTMAQKVALHELSEGRVEDSMLSITALITKMRELPPDGEYDSLRELYKQKVGTIIRDHIESLGDNFKSVWIDHTELAPDHLVTLAFLAGEYVKGCDLPDSSEDINLDLSEYALEDKQLEAFRQEAVRIYQAHDAYSIGLTLIKTVSGMDFDLSFEGPEKALEVVEKRLGKQARSVLSDLLSQNVKTRLEAFDRSYKLFCG